MSCQRTAILRKLARLRQHTLEPWVSLQLLLDTARCKVGADFSTLDRIVVRNEGSIVIAADCEVRGPGPALVEFRCARGASLHIGSHTFMNWGILLDAHHQIEIGRDCMLASQVIVCDKRPYREGAIHIENNVWIAHAAIIEPGVHIGANSVIGAKAVVRHDVPPDCLAIGNPARCMPLRLLTR